MVIDDHFTLTAMIENQSSENSSCDRLRLGVVGCGTAFAAYHYPALNNSHDWLLAAACDPGEKRRRWLRGTDPTVPIYESLAAMLGQTRLDGILVAAPPAAHCALVLEALGAGIPVLVEKPMALTLAEGRAMQAAAKAAGKPLQVGFTRRFREPYRQLRQYMNAPGMPPHEEIHFDLLLDSLGWGAVTSYLGDEKGGGSIWDDVASHQFDLLRWLTGWEIDSVRVMDASPSVSGADWARFEVRFKNGRTASCRAGHGNRYLERLLIRTGRTWFTASPCALLRTPYRPGFVSDLYGRVRSFAHHGFCRLTGKANVTLKSFEDQLTSFARAVRDPGTPHAAADGLDGLQTLAAAMACRQAINARGEWLPVIKIGGEEL